MGENGTTETHVFEGEVVVRRDALDQKKESLHLKDHMAVRVGRNQETPNQMDAAPERFTLLRFKDEPTSHKPTVDRKLSLWLSADRRLQVDEEGRVSAWGDLCTESNKSEQNAWQVDPSKRPQRVEDAIGGLPAIRFDRRKFMVTEPLRLGSPQSLVAVLRLDSKLMNRWGINENGRQIINMNGPPQLVLSINDRKQLVSRNYTGFLTSDEGVRKYVSVGRIRTENSLNEEPFVAVTVYDPASDSSRLYLNGELAGKANAPQLQPTESPRYIGSHMFLLNTNFLGDIAEVMIYDTGLTEEESVTLSRALMKKYGISVEAVGG